jgi:phosphatidylglycerol:prolipoprotein diacylglycerol transferase
VHPILAQFGAFTLHSYGFMIAIGFVIAMQVILRLAGRSGLDRDRVQDLVFATLFVGFIGARLVFVLTQLPDFLANPLNVFKVWEGGLVFYGGPLVGVPFVYWFTKRFGLPLWKTGDALMPGLVIAHAFGRLGCFAAGCCYGRPTDSVFGVRFHSDLVERALRGVPLHPTQLYETVALLILFVGLLWTHRHRRFDGQVVLLYFTAYPTIRSIIEFYRGDSVRGFVIEGILSTSQFISLLVFLAAFVVLVLRLRSLNSKPNGDGGPR